MSTEPTDPTDPTMGSIDLPSANVSPEAVDLRLPLASMALAGIGQDGSWVFQATLIAPPGTFKGQSAKLLQGPNGQPLGVPDFRQVIAHDGRGGPYAILTLKDDSILAEPPPMPDLAALLGPK